MEAFNFRVVNHGIKTIMISNVNSAYLALQVGTPYVYCIETEIIDLTVSKFRPNWDRGEV